MDYYQVQRDLKSKHGYSIGEQEEMYPFERDLLLTFIQQENLAEANIPAQGWTQYAKEVGASQKTKYTEKFKTLDYGK